MHLIHRARSWAKNPVVISVCMGVIFMPVSTIVFRSVLFDMLEQSPAMYCDVGAVLLWGLCSAIVSLAGMFVVILTACVAVDRGLGISKEWARQSSGSGVRNAFSGNFGYGCALSWTVINAPLCFVFLIGYVVKVSFDPHGFYPVANFTLATTLATIVLGAVFYCFINRRVGISKEWVRQRFLRTRECSKCKYPVISDERDVHGKRSVWLCTECGSRFDADGFRIKEALGQNSPQGA